MKKEAVIFVAAVSLLSSTTVAHCDREPSYQETVTAIRETMSRSTSVFRKESYGYINFDRCKLSYNVAGTYPTGGTYDIKYRDIDLSSINPGESKTSHDYTAFVVLNFKNYASYDTGYENLKIESVVINVSDDGAAQSLLGAFLRMGELCSTEKPGNATR